MKFVYATLIMIASLIFSCAHSNDITLSNAESFSKICDMFTDVQTSNLTSLSLEEKGEYITKQTNTTNLSKNAKDSFAALATVDPAQKYDLFKKIAEEYTKQPWDCSPMKELLTIISDSQYQSND